MSSSGVSYYIARKLYYLFETELVANGAVLPFQNLLSVNSSEKMERSS